jgi:nuclear pore complex protein Nup62
MDEILTRWASDLSNYQKEFQKQAGQISNWDRLLVENTDKISKLHTKTFQAERDAGEVERQLTTVENQQEELEAWLDKYEREVDDMVQKAGLDANAGGVDLERERTYVIFKFAPCREWNVLTFNPSYKLAEKLTERLDSTNKDLEDIILEINHVSSQLSKTKGPDDHVRYPFRRKSLCRRC